MRAATSTQKKIHVEDVEWLADAGETWDAIATRLGAKPNSVRRACARAHRPDLIDRLDQRHDERGWRDLRARHLDFGEPA